MVLVKVIPQELVTVETESAVVIVDHFPDRYEGEYEVTPRRFTQKLNTKNKSMANDVTVYNIPFAEAINLSGGYTVNIGG